MDYYDEDFEESEWKDDDDTEESEEEEQDDEEGEDEEEEDEEEEDEEEEDEKKKKSKKSKWEKDVKNKNMDEITEEDWLKLAAKQEKEMRKNGTYYSTKYNKDDIVMLKQKGWSDFKKGKVMNVNRNRKRAKVTYDIKLINAYKGKKIYKKNLSTRIKKFENDEEEDPLEGPKRIDET